MTLVLPTAWSEARAAGQEPIRRTITGVVLDLDTALKPAQLPSTWNEPAQWIENGVRGTRRPRYAQQDYLLRAITETNRGTLNRDALRRQTVAGNVYHPNYLVYLEQCYANHWTPVFTPDILWFTLMNEVATVVRENAKGLRDLFTTTAGKQLILVQTGDPYVLPLDLVVDRLRGLVPAGADQFLPTFTTSTEASRLAFAAAFCDMVSPYYEYGMFCCGYPRIVIQGDIPDYVDITERWRNLPATLIKVMSAYHAKTLGTLEQVTRMLDGASRNADEALLFWQGMFKAERCGSGHQTEIKGWFVDLFRRGTGKEGRRGAPRYASNYDPHVAKVDYKNVSTDRTFTMLHGVFGSLLGESGVAAPEFGSAVFETTL